MKKISFARIVPLVLSCLCLVSCIDTKSLAKASLASIFEAYPNTEKNNMVSAGVPGIYIHGYETKDSIYIGLWRKAPKSDINASVFGDGTYRGLFPVDLDHQAFVGIFLEYLLGKGINPVFVDHTEGGRFISLHPSVYKTTVIYLDTLGSNLTIDTYRDLESNYDTSRYDQLPPVSSVDCRFYKTSGMGFMSPLESILYQRQRDNWNANLSDLVLSWHEASVQTRKRYQAFYDDMVATGLRRLESLGAMFDAEEKSHQITGDMLATAIGQSAKSMARNAAAGGLADLTPTDANGDAPGAGYGSADSSAASSSRSPGSVPLTLTGKSMKKASDGVGYASYFDKRGGNMVSPVHIAYGPGRTFADYDTAYAEAKRQYESLLEIRKKKFEDATTPKAVVNGTNDENSQKVISR